MVGSNKKIIVISILINMFLSACTKRQELVVLTDSLSSAERQQLHDGDIIMRMGFGQLSQSIVSMLDEKQAISHCGIVCISDSDTLVIHSISGSLSYADGVQSCSLNEFFKDSRPHSLMITRFKSKDNSFLSCGARNYLKQRIPFDNYFDFEDSSRFYCSELPIHIMEQKLGRPIFSNKNQRERLQFSNFANRSYFRIILNHAQNEK